MVEIPTHMGLATQIPMGLGIPRLEGMAETLMTPMVPETPRQGVMGETLMTPMDPRLLRRAATEEVLIHMAQVTPTHMAQATPTPMVLAIPPLEQRDMVAMILMTQIRRVTPRLAS
jgi:hypothetical protein